MYSNLGNNWQLPLYHQRRRAKKNRITLPRQSVTQVTLPEQENDRDRENAPTPSDINRRGFGRRKNDAHDAKQWQPAGSVGSTHHAGPAPRGPHISPPTRDAIRPEASANIFTIQYQISTH